MTLMQNVRAMASDLLTQLPKINFLIHCAGVASLSSDRTETSEGLEPNLATRYYSKFALTYDLLPLLRNAKGLDEAAAVMSVFTAGLSPEIDLDDLGLKKNYSGYRMMGQSSAYNDVMLQEFSRREPTIAFVHTHPGWVYTGQFTSSHPVYKTLLWLMHPLFLLVLTPPQECAEYMTYALLNADRQNKSMSQISNLSGNEDGNGKGFRRYNWCGDDIGMKSMPVAKDAGRILWDHSVDVTGVMN